MPLDYGINDFWSSSAGTYDQDSALSKMFAKRGTILAFFRDNQDLLVKPYIMGKVEVRTKIESLYDDDPDDVLQLPDEYDVVFHQLMQSSCASNPIYDMLLNAGMGVLQIDVVPKFNRWIDVRFADGLQDDEEAHGYALIDLCLYTVFLLNIYEPNKALIANLYATNVQIDAVGRENDAPAIKAVAKVVCKAMGQSASFYPAERYAAHLLMFARANAASRSQPTLSKGIGFERDCEQHLLNAGFEVQTTPSSGDFGADLIAFKDGLGYAIQCKDTAKPVGVKGVQEAVGARSHYKTDYAAVCCSGGFTDAAVELATSNKVLLCNLDQLARRLDSV